MIIGSEAFADGGLIPGRHTCDGDDVSPSLVWSGAPEGTVTLALVMDDPDASGGTWVHWVLFNLPAAEAGLPEGAPLPRGTRVGTNSWGRPGYGGPCPPSGTHRYFFRLYALDGSLDLGPGATAAVVSRATKGRVIAEAVLMGRYARRRDR